MTRFLSPEWLEQATGAVAARSREARIADHVSLTVRQTVQGGPDGDVAYTVRFENGHIEFTPKAAGEADVEVATAYETAVAISRGELSPAVALAAGVLRVSGNVGLLAEYREAWASLDDLLSPVRATTTY